MNKRNEVVIDMVLNFGIVLYLLASSSNMNMSRTGTALEFCDCEIRNNRRYGEFQVSTAVVFYRKRSANARSLTAKWQRGNATKIRGEREAGRIQHTLPEESRFLLSAASRDEQACSSSAIA